MSVGGGGVSTTGTPPGEEVRSKYMPRTAGAQPDHGGIDTVVHPDDLAGVHARLNSLEQLPDGAWVSVEFRFKHPHGEWRWLLNRTTVFERDEDSTVRKILGSIIDITERKQLEQALSKSERFNRAVLSVIPVQLYIYDVHQQRNTWVNAAQREFLDEVGIDYNAPP